MRRDRRTACGLFAAALAAYFATSSRHLAGGDNAEFVTIFAAGGVAHPSGYPLYCILLRLFAWMPGGPVLGSSRATAVLGALAVVVLYRACLAWGASGTASLVAAASYALSPVAWRLATEAEVFALNALFGSLLLWAAAPRVVMASAVATSPGVATSPAVRVVVLAGLAGLALSHHLTIVLLAPIGLFATYHALISSRPPARVAVLAVAAFAAGLLPYLYCYEVGCSPDGRYVWGEPGTWSGLLHHITRADFGSLSLTADERSPERLSNVWTFFAQTANDMLVVPLAFGFFGFWRTCVADASSRGRRGAFALFATWVLAGPVFAAFLNVPPDAIGATLWDRFRILPEVVFTIAVAWGLDGWRALREGRALPVGLASVAVATAGALHSWPRVREAHTNALELYTKNTERSVPPRSLILGTGDYRLFSFLYAEAIHLRPDVTYIDPHLLGYDWYRARAARELGASISTPGDAISLVEQAFSLGRPVLLTDIFDAQLVNVFPTYPIGTLIRLLPRDAMRPSPELVEQENLGVFAAFQRWDPTPRDDEWATAVLPAYQRPWVALARMFEKHRDGARAQANRERAAQWGRSDGE